MSRRAPAADPLRAVAYLRVSTDEQALGPEAHAAQLSIEARCAPDSGVCLVSELSGDNFDSLGGRDKVSRVLVGQATQHWGYPCCAGPGLPVPGATPADCTDVDQETVGVTLHDTPFGMDFEPGTWPGPYRKGFFVALHGQVGSWTGTSVVWLPTEPATGLPQPLPGSTPTKPQPIPKFLTGFGHGAGTVNGRATDITFAPDGRMFVIDDISGRVWWIAPIDLPVPPGW